MATYDITKITLPSGDIANLKDANATKTEASTTNGNIKIDSVETPVYRNYGNNTVLTTDKTLFLARQTLNPTGFSGYVREKLVGASYAWNQLVENGNFASTSGWTAQRGTISASNNVLSYTLTEVGVADVQNRIERYVNVIQGHKYLLSASFKPAHTTKVGFRNAQSAFTLGETTVPSTTFTRVSAIFNATATTSLNMYWVWVCGDAGYSVGDVNQIKECQVIDLTLAFGSTIADYLHGLSNNGGITKLRDMGCPIDKYTAYGNYLVSSKTSGKKIVGKNLFDTSKIVTGTLSDGAWTISTDGGVKDAYTGYFLPNTQYTFSGYEQQSASSKNVRLTVIYTDGTAVNMFSDSGTTKTAFSYTSVSGKTIEKVGMSYGSMVGAPTCTITDFQIEIGTSATTYEPYSSTTYSLGNDELRGKFDLVNGEIVASGDVKESNGGIARNRKRIELNSVNYTYNSTNAYFYTGDIADRKYGNNILCLSSHYTDVGDKSASDMASVANMSMASNNNNVQIKFKNTAYTDATAFKNAMAGVYLEYDLATPTTEQSTPFADPMSMVGATTEEYIDDRTIPCPVGAERQYMGQSEDIVEIPSSPQSDGKRKLVAETSGGKTQYYFENDSDKPKRTMLVNLESYSSHSNKYEAPCDGYAMIMVYAGTGLVVMEVSDCNGVTLAMQSVSNPPTTSYVSSFMKKGMKFHYTNNDGLSVSPAFRGIT